MPTESSGTILTTCEQIALLKKYEPVLHFAQGEQFFPMNAEDFIYESALKNKEGKIINKRGEKHDIGNFISGNDYLHFTYENKGIRRLHTISLVGFSLLLFFFLLISVQPNNISITSISNGDETWPKLWNGFIDDIKLVLLALGLTFVWARTRGNRRIQFTFFLAFVLTLFLGTAISVGLSVLALLMIFVIGIMYLVLTLLSPISENYIKPFQTQYLQPLLKDESYFRANLLVGLVILLITLAIRYPVERILLGINGLLNSERTIINQFYKYIYNSDLKFDFDFNKEFDIEMYVGTSQFLPDTFIALLKMVFILTITGLVIWFLLATVLESLKNRKRLDHWLKNHSLDWQTDIVPLLVLITSTIFWGLLWFFFNDLGLFEAGDHTDDRTIAYSYLATIPISALLWYYVNPLTPISRRLVGEPHQNKSGLLKPLFGVFIGFLVYFIVSVYLVGIFSIQFALKNELQNAPQLIWLSIIVVSTITMIFYVAIIISGPQLAGFTMNLQSRVPDSVADWAKRKYEKTLANKESSNKKYIYYGRVKSRSTWTVLQYHFFYAYNDWRSAGAGINQHEGDWEAVAIFLENPREDCCDYTPFGVALSQHHDGDFRFWKDVSSVNNHPDIYVAHGSHANYFEGEEYNISNFLPTGVTRTIVERIDSIIGNFHRLNNGLPTENAKGEGRTIGEWNLELLTNDSPYWVNFQGYWGNKTRHPDESGPKGPKWRRNPENRPKTIGHNKKTSFDLKSYEDPDFKIEQRPRWRLHAWKDMLLLNMLHDVDISIRKRRKALQHLQTVREQDTT